MSGVITKEKLILEIKEMITCISGSDSGKPINLHNVSVHQTGRSACGGKINISCIFINEDGNVCADMYRLGIAGCVDFICGLVLDSVDETILNEILYAFSEHRWSLDDYPDMEKDKKKKFASNFRIPFLQKSAS